MGFDRLVLCALASAACLGLLNGCGEGPAAPPTAEALSRALQPESAALASIYQRSCAGCHTVAATGAPLTGDSVAWAPRVAKGTDILVNNVVSGVGNMPPSGLCGNCDVEEFEALIQFMSTGK